MAVVKLVVPGTAGVVGHVPVIDGDPSARRAVQSRPYAGRPIRIRAAGKAVTA